MAGREVISIDSDSDSDDDLRRAIALSLQDQNGTSHSTDAASDETQPTETGPSSGVTLGSLPLDRKQMEQERLERLAKKRGLPSENGPNDASGPPTKKQATAEPTSSLPLKFPDGTVKRTWARGYPRTSEDITIEEVFQKEDLQLALLSSFQWDEEWMLSKVDFPRTKILLLAFASSEGQKQQMRSNVPSNIKFCFPPMNGPGSMHSKLQILRYSTHLRIAIPTGNLVPYDWGETGVMENMVFLIDLPRLEDNGAASLRPAETRFSKDLSRFLSAAGVDDKMVNSLRNYDFSATADIGFVYSIPGSHVDASRDGVGYCGLGSSVRDLASNCRTSNQGDIDPDTDVDVDVACASLGSLNCDFISAIYNACKGDDGMKEYNQRTTRKPATSKDTRPSKQLRDGFRIYFPTNKTVTESKGGRRAAGTICLQARWWRSATFPRELVRDCVNNRPGLLMHTKVMFVRRRLSPELKAAAAEEGQAPEASRTEAAAARSAARPLGWAYVGSANLSESAWGKLTKDKATGKAKMTCRNWECGVLLSANRVSPSLGSEQATGNGMSTFSGVVPVPMRVPGCPYEAGQLPWFFSGDE